MAKTSQKCLKYIVFEVSDASESFSLCLNRLYYLVESVRVFSRIKNISEGVNYVKNDVVFGGFTFISAMTNMNEVITDCDSKGNYLYF